MELGKRIEEEMFAFEEDFTVLKDFQMLEVCGVHEEVLERCQGGIGIDYGQMCEMVELWLQNLLEIGQLKAGESAAKKIYKILTVKIFFQNFHFNISS